MSKLKQNIWVVSILFFSLMSSVALSYAITPNTNTMTAAVKTIKVIKEELNKEGLNKTLTILLPQVGK